MSKVKVTGSIGISQFVPVSFCLIDNEVLGMAEKFLYVLLCRYKGKGTDKCWPSLTTLEKKTQWTKKTILKKIEILEDVGLIIKKNHIYEAKQNNTYILISPEIAFGIKQLHINDLTEEEAYTLNELGDELVIQKSDGTIVICSSEKNKIFLNMLYETLDNYASAIYNDNKFSEVKIIIDEITKFYENIASSPYVFLNKQIDNDTEKVSSEQVLEQLKEYNINDVVRIVRQVNIDGIPKEYETIGKNTYILNLLWGQREQLANSILKKILAVNKELNLKGNI